MRPLVRATLAVAAISTLGGCDLALAGPFMPPIFPGAGFPLTGVVLDSLTRLPVGGATVQSGVGSTVTDGTGHFSIYGGLGSREVSVSRAGYAAQTEGDVDPNAGGDLQFALDPLYPDKSTPTELFAELSGTVSNIPQGQAAQVFFAGQNSSISNGTYDVTLKANSPGKVISSVIAWGAVTGPYNQAFTAGQTFYYKSFYYLAGSWGLGPTVPQSKITQPLPPTGATAAAAQTAQMSNTAVKYKNLGTTFTSVQTQILLDFGLLGSVPVAIQSSSNQTIPVPSIPGLKYDIVGTAMDATKSLTSSVQLTTNDPGAASFQLLDAPKVLSPTNGASSVGQRPTFSWVSGGDGITYQISLQEDGLPKWSAHTSATSIQYPGFSQGDINGGALMAGKKYTWTLRELDILGAQESPTSKADDPIHIEPYRVRQREADATGMAFTL